MKEPKATTCAACKRVVYATDVDAKGLCCFCQPADPPAEAKP